MAILSNNIFGIFSIKKVVNRLCAEAVQQQIQLGVADATQLRNRRRHLAKQVFKRIPVKSYQNSQEFFRAATMVLSLVGFSSLIIPQPALAEPVFKHSMLDGFVVGYQAVPTFADLDGDGDLDAFVGNLYGEVQYFRNIGTNIVPNFVADVAGNPLAGLNFPFNVTPTFTDLDGDGDFDIFVGASEGKVKFYRNTGTSTSAHFVVDAVNNPLAGLFVGSRTAPVFVDIDGDSDFDAFIGEGSGSIKFYRNIGTTTVPNLVVDVVGNPLSDFNVGYVAAPTFADIDNDGDLDVFVGEGRGTIRFYRNTGTSTGPVFVADVAGNPLTDFDVGFGAWPTFADIDNDGDLDAFVGVAKGTVEFYRNTGTNINPNFESGVAGNPLAGVSSLGFNSIPGFADLDGDGDLDAFVGEYYGTVKFYHNIGTNVTPTFVLDIASNPLAGIDVGRQAAPVFVDLDNDGDLDVFVGEEFGKVFFYRNTGTNTTPNFVTDFAGNPLAGFDVGNAAVPAFVDIDGDGDLDSFVGNSRGSVMFYRNNGINTAPNFIADASGNPLAAIYLFGNAVPKFADLDGDGDMDVFVGEQYGAIEFYLNIGSNTVPNFVSDTVGNPLLGFGVGSYAAPAFADLDSDGDLDAFVGERYGVVKFFENIDPTSNGVTKYDFNGDRKSDILIRNGSGFLAMYQMNGASRTLFAVGGLPLDWNVQEVGDFNGDGKADILIRNGSGFLSMYQMNGASRTLFAVGGLPLDWNVVQVGDFNGDGNADILIRNSSGFLAMYQMNSASRRLLSIGGLPLDWNVQGVGDFNGDGNADILIRNGSGFLSMYQMNGASRTLFAVGGLPLDWNVEQVGDFNGDRKADILIRNSSGFLAMYQMNGAKRTLLPIGGLPLEWNVQEVADFNGDGNADILIRNGSGFLAMYQMNGASRTLNAVGGLPTTWDVQTVGQP
ncbi:MAG: VCBS repeat-containing protein [Methylococcaceae bacterium]|nr:VCBS repeat-containing protein [Methylococcaceae bacterium]